MPRNRPPGNCFRNLRVRASATAVPAVVAVIVALVGCSEQRSSSGPTSTPASATVHPPVSPVPEQVAPLPDGLRPRVADDPVRLVEGLVADEKTLRNPSSSEALVLAAARRQQMAYRVLGHRPEWDALTRALIPPSLLEVYDRNVEARRQLTAMSKGYAAAKLPAWEIKPPTPAGELMGYYRKSEAASGVGWSYLAAINLVETAFGRIAGVSSAGARGPMQFLPSTFAIHGSGGDIESPHDSIMAAGRFLAAHGFARDRDRALYRYNNSTRYVRAVNQYAAVIGADAAAFGGYHRWDVYYNSTAGDVLLPIGYSAAAPIPVADYLRAHPQ